MLMRTKTHDRILAAAQRSYDSDLQILEDQRRAAADEAAQWRARYEALLNTPEIKADTEAAFKRGEQQATRKFKAFLMHAATNYAV